MSDVITFTPEQFDTLIGAVKGAHGGAQGPTGLGAAPKRSSVGVGFGPNGYGILATGVEEYLAAGYPRLALARAIGAPFAPYMINIKASFSDDTVTDVPEVGSDVKIVQDTIIDGMIVRVQSLNPPDNVFQPQSDYFNGFQSGITATLDVLGAPRYSVAPKFTLLSNLADAVNGSGRWPVGWILTYQQQLQMSFHADVTLTNVPIDVWVSFRAWVPQNEMFVQMSNMEALRQLRKECGIEVDESYANRVCR